MDRSLQLLWLNLQHDRPVYRYRYYPRFGHNRPKILTIRHRMVCSERN
jgi:hypothetical protein